MTNSFQAIRDAGFFNRHAVEVARDLIGKRFVFYDVDGLITETEAYRAEDDKACHAYGGITPRTQALFGPPGRMYIYFIYGMYYCMNFVTQEEGSASGVLIRGLLLPDKHLNGPGKICKHLGITKKEYGLNLLTHEQVYLAQGVQYENISVTPRIGITKDTDKLWRFVAKDLVG